MSYLNPADTELTSLKGIDKKVQNIQTAMKTGIPWLTYSFGLSDRVVEKRDLKDYVFPAVFVSNTYDPLSMLPSDNYPAFSFWVKKSEAKVPDYSYTAIVNPRLMYEVSCIFFMNLPQVYSLMTWKEAKSQARHDIIRFFTTGCIGLGLTLRLISIVDDDITEVYDGYSLEQLDNRFMMMPNYAIRINFELEFLPECP